MTSASGRAASTVVLVALAAIGLDWSTKVIASSVLDDGPVEVTSLLNLRLSHNPGVAFGLGNGLPGPVVILVTAAVTAVLAVAALRGWFPSRVAAGLILGGAVANLLDRMVGGTVVDFLDLGWWPSFNLADAFLSAGCVLMVALSFREEARTLQGS